MFKPPLRKSRPLGDISNTGTHSTEHLSIEYLKKIIISVDQIKRPCSAAVMSWGSDPSKSEQQSSSPMKLQPGVLSIPKQVTPSPFLPPVKPSSLEQPGHIELGPHVEIKSANYDITEGESDGIAIIEGEPITALQEAPTEAGNLVDAVPEDESEF